MPPLVYLPYHVLHLPVNMLYFFSFLQYFLCCFFVISCKSQRSGLRLTARAHFQENRLRPAVSSGAVHSQVLHSFHQVINILCFDSSPHAEYSRNPTDRGGHPRSVGAAGAAADPRNPGSKKEDAYASSSAISASQFASVSTSGTKPSSRCVPHTSVGTMRISSPDAVSSVSCSTAEA